MLIEIDRYEKKWIDVDRDMDRNMSRCRQKSMNIDEMDEARGQRFFKNLVSTSPSLPPSSLNLFYLCFYKIH